MGVIRGGLFTILCILLFLIFLVGNIFLTLTLSLNYENVKSELASVVNDAIKKEISLLGDVEEEFAYMELYCEHNLEFIFEDDISEYDFEIPCEIISQGFDTVIDYQVSSFVEKIYYQDYNCTFLDCIQNTEGIDKIFFFVSENAKNYWKNKFYFSLMISVVLIVLMFFLVEQKYNLPVVVGSLLAVSSLPFMKLNWFFIVISDDSLLQFFTLFFTKAYIVFLISFIFGLTILGVGIGLKFLNLDFLKKKFSRAEVKEIVKQEISKKSKKSKK